MELSSCSLEELDNRFKKGKAVMPQGYLYGQVLLFIHGKRQPFLSRLIELFWKGKFFQAPDCVNKLLGIKLIHARLSFGNSMFDGKKAVILDYSVNKVPFIKHVVDELKEIAPGQFLGRAYYKKKFVLYFAHY